MISLNLDNPHSGFILAFLLLYAHIFYSTLKFLACLWPKQYQMHYCLGVTNIGFKNENKIKQTVSSTAARSKPASYFQREWLLLQDIMQAKWEIQFRAASQFTGDDMMMATKGCFHIVCC